MSSASPSFASDVASSICCIVVKRKDKGNEEDSSQEDKSQTGEKEEIVVDAAATVAAAKASPEQSAAASIRSSQQHTILLAEVEADAQGGSPILQQLHHPRPGDPPATDAASTAQKEDEGFCLSDIADQVVAMAEESPCASSRTASMPYVIGCGSEHNNNNQPRHGDDVASSIGVDSYGVPHDIVSMMMLKSGPEMVDFKGAKGLVKRDAINAAINVGLSRHDYPVAVIWGPRGSGKTVAARMYAEEWERRGGTYVMLNGSSESSLQQSWMDAQQASSFPQPQDEATSNGIRCLCVVEDVAEVSSFIESFQRQRVVPPLCAVLYTTSDETVALALAQAPEASADASVLTPDEAVAVITAVFPEMVVCRTEAEHCVIEENNTSSITAGFPQIAIPQTLHQISTVEQPQASDPKQSCAGDVTPLQATHSNTSVVPTYEKDIATTIAEYLLKYCGNRADLVHRCAMAYASTVNSAPHKEAVFSATRFASWIESEWRWLAQLMMARHTQRVPYRQLAHDQSTVQTYTKDICAVDDDTQRRNNKEDRRVEFSHNEVAAAKRSQPVIFDLMNIGASKAEGPYTTFASFTPDVERPHIASAIVSGHSRQDWPVAAVWGPSGCGKSTAARMAASTWQGSTLTLEGSSEGSLQMALLQHLPTELETQLRKDKATTTQIARWVIRTLPPPLLLILEDVDDMEFGRRIVQVLVDLNITTCPPMIIVTTHQRDVAFDVARREDAVANASKLTTAEAAALFRSVVDFGASETSLETLLDTYCGNSAWLVYRCATSCRLSFAADAKTRSCAPSVDSLAQWFTSEWSRVAQDGADRTAWRVFDMTMAHAKDLWPTESTLLETAFRIVAQLLQTATGLVDISRALFVRIVTMVLAGAQSTSDTVAEVVIRLGEHIGLVKRITNGSITFHRLDLEGAWMQSEALHCLATRVYIDWSHKTLEQERDQAELRLLRHLAPQSSGVPLLDAKADALRGKALLRLGVAAEASEVLQRAVVTMKAHFGENHVEVGMTLTNFGAALNDLGKADEALAHYEQALSILKAHFGEKHVEVAMTLDNIGNALRAVGKPDEALAHCNQALSIRKAHFGENHVEVAAVLNNIALVFVTHGTNHMLYRHCALFAEAYRFCVSTNRSGNRMMQLLHLAFSEGSTSSCVSLKEFAPVLRLCSGTLQRLQRDVSLGVSISAKLYSATSPVAFPRHSVCLDVSEFVDACPPGYCITLAFTAFYPFVPPYVRIYAQHQQDDNAGASGTSTFLRLGYPQHPAVNKANGLVNPVLINKLWYDATLMHPPSYDLRHAVRAVSAMLLLHR